MSWRIKVTAWLGVAWHSTGVEQVSRCLVCQLSFLVSVCVVAADAQLSFHSVQLALHDLRQQHTTLEATYTTQQQHVHELEQLITTVTHARDAVQRQCVQMKEEMERVREEKEEEKLAQQAKYNQLLEKHK